MRPTVCCRYLDGDIEGLAGELLRHLVGQVQRLDKEVGGLDVPVSYQVGRNLESEVNFIIGKSTLSEKKHLCHSGAEFRKFVIRKLLVDNLGDNPDDLPVYSRLLKRQ